MSATHEPTDRATERVLAGIEDPELAARYPNRTHFVSAENPHHGELVTRALFQGDPVALIYKDGREFLFTPDQMKGLAALVMLVVVLLVKWRSRKTEGETIQFPPRTRIQARDSSGIPIAA